MTTSTDWRFVAPMTLGGSSARGDIERRTVLKTTYERWNAAWKLWPLDGPQRHAATCSDGRYEWDWAVLRREWVADYSAVIDAWKAQAGPGGDAP